MFNSLSDDISIFKNEFKGFKGSKKRKTFQSLIWWFSEPKYWWLVSFHPIISKINGLQNLGTFLK